MAFYGSFSGMKQRGDLPDRVILIVEQMDHDSIFLRKIHHRFTDLFSLLFVDGNPAGVKAMLSEMGFIQNVLRLPLVPMQIKNRQRMSEILKELKI